jgi:hypothetical protein
MRADLRPDPRDELLHTPEGDPSIPWKDTWYFSLVDVGRQVHLAMHMTVTAGRDADTRVAVGLRDAGAESVEVRVEAGRNDDSGIGNSLARVEVVHLSWDGDHQVRWRADAPDFAFDILVTGVHYAPLFDTMFPDVNPTGKQGHSYSHTEQVVRGEGTVRWRDGREQTISAFGWRDRGWGRRTNELAFGTGYDLIAGILPDGGAFALSGMRNVEHGADAPLPIYGFRTDASGAVPAVAGIWHKDSMCYPTRLGLEFADGSRVDAEQVGRLSTLSVPFHDAQPEVFGIAVNARDYYAMLVDTYGNRFPVFSNEGHALRADVTGGARFFHAEGLAPSR